MYNPKFDLFLNLAAYEGRRDTRLGPLYSGSLTDQNEILLETNVIFLNILLILSIPGVTK